MIKVTVIFSYNFQRFYQNDRLISPKYLTAFKKKCLQHSCVIIREIFIAH